MKKVNSSTKIERLLEKYENVWFFIPSEECREKFKNEIRNFRPENPEILGCCGNVMTVDKEKNVRFVSYVVWSQSFKKEYFANDVKVDYTKVCNGSDDFEIASFLEATNVFRKNDE